MKVVILAAGAGSRMGGVPKPLVKVGGTEIIRRTIKLLSPHATEFVVVTGIYHDQIVDFLDELKREMGIKYVAVKNDHPEWGNGYSLYLARNFAGEKFYLVMGDHVYGRDFIEEAVRGDGLIGDAEARFVDEREATKVRIRDGRVEVASKDLAEYDCIDTGFFVLSKDVFEVIEEMMVESSGKMEELKLSDVISRAKIPVTFVNGRLWMDVDVKEDIRKANRLLVMHSVKGKGDGVVSRYFNRRISTFISTLLVNHATPSQMTLVSFLSGILSSLLLLFNVQAGAVAYQISSILDGCDGEMARASLRESKVGGYVDSVLDRIVDFAFLATLSLLYPQYLPIAIFAIFGSVMVSYTSEKYKAEFGKSISDDIEGMKYLIGKRDERIFLIMVLAFIGRIYELFAVVTAISFFRFIGTVALVLKHRKRF